MKQMTCKCRYAHQEGAPPCGELSHQAVHLFLQHMVGFDSVDDESLGEKKIWREPPRCDAWDTADNPPYSYYVYHMW